MDSRTKTLAIAGAVLLAIFLMMRKGSKEERVAQNDTPKEVKSSKKEVPARQKARLAAKSVPKNLPLEVRNTSAGLRTVAYAEGKNGNPVLKFRIAAKGVCHPGDFEALQNTLGKNGSVTFTLEPISKTKKVRAKVARKDVTLAQISKGTIFEMPVDKKRGGVYGFFLCTDSASKGSCIGKRPADFNMILAKRGGRAAQDAIYYFQFIALKPDSSLFFSGTAEAVDNTRDNLSDQGFSESELDQDLNYAKQMLRGVQPIPPVTKAAGDDTAIEIPVARFDPKSCQPPTVKVR